MTCDPLYWFWKSELPPAVCDAIIQEGLKLEFKQAEVGDDEKVNTGIRASKVAFFPGNSWVSAITSHYMNVANNQAWKFAITGQQNPQFTIYDLDEFYDFHEDQALLGDNMRKLSVVISVTDPALYTGGEFEFEDGVKPEIKERGSIIVFPSFVRHRVTPVSTGTRYSLVNWFVGPQFK